MRVLIIGQGLAGSWLSYYLLKNGVEVFVLDKVMENSSSRVASGVINPVTGRQVVTTWLADFLLPLANSAYKEMEEELGGKYVQDCGIYSFPSSQQMADVYVKKISEGSTYIHAISEQNPAASFFKSYYAPVHIHPAYFINVQAFINDYRAWLQAKSLLIAEHFQEEDLRLTKDGIVYGDKKADYVFYCQGSPTASSIFWKGLPFAITKGQALITDIPDLPRNQIYKFGTNTLVPWQNGLWWVGSTYEHNYTTTEPTPDFYNRTSWFLQEMVKVPANIVEQIASLRPTTLERRPFVGFHPHHSQIGILGGLGTKGVSLSPWLAQEVASLLVKSKALTPEIDVRRYKRAFQ